MPAAPLSCAAAQALLAEGIVPGPANPTSRALGFHISQCAACHARLHAPLLAELLSELPPDPPRRRSWAHAQPTNPTKGRRQKRVGHGAVWFRLALIAMVLGGFGLLAGPLLGDLWRIRANMLAMRSTPVAAAEPAAAARATIIPAEVVANALAALPTARLAPSSTAAPLGAALGSAPAALAPSSTAATTLAPSATVAAPVGAALGSEPAALATLAPSATVAAPVVARQPSATIVRLPSLNAPERNERLVPTLAPTSAASSAAAPNGPRPANAPLPSGALTVLILGMDRRPGEGLNTRSDAVAIAYFDPTRQRIALLSLPRDLVVAIPGVGYARVNAATAYGGPELARATISQLLGLPINYVVQFDFSGFVQAVDAVGGVVVDVEKALYDASYPTTDYGTIAVSFAPGPQLMDGQRALIYSRIRHPDSDYERMRRQQTVMLAVLARIREQGLLDQLTLVADLTTALRPSIYTDLSDQAIVELALALRELDPSAVERLTLDGNQTISGSIQGDPYALIAVPGALEGRVGQLLGQ